MRYPCGKITPPRPRGWYEHRIQKTLSMSDNDENFQMSELIMINPFNNLSFTFIGIVRTIQIEDYQTVFLGIIEIDQDTICCLCKAKDDVAPTLEFIFSLKYHHTKFRHRFRLYKTLFADIVMN
jgi:hypothetical protein